MYIHKDKTRDERKSTGVGRKMDGTLGNAVEGERGQTDWRSNNKSHKLAKEDLWKEGSSDEERDNLKRLARLVTKLSQGVEKRRVIRNPQSRMTWTEDRTERICIHASYRIL